MAGPHANPDSEHSNAAIWKRIRQEAHQLATRQREPTDHVLDEFTRLVESLPAPGAPRSDP